jgi:hypothetical protein
MDLSQLNSLLENLEYNPVQEHHSLPQQISHSLPQQTYNSPLQQISHSLPQQPYSHKLSDEALQSEKINKNSETLKDETNKRINSYNNHLGFNAAQNRQHIAGQLDFKSFMNTPQQNSQSKNSINEKLSSRENFIFQGGDGPAFFDMKPKLTRDINKAKQNF